MTTNQKKEPTVLKTNASRLPPVLLEKLERFFVVQSFNSLPSYTFSFLTSDVTILLFDYSYYLKKLSKTDAQKQTRDSNLTTCYKRLQEFVGVSKAPYILFLGPKVDDFLPAFTHDIRKRIELENPEKMILYGFSTSWRDVASQLFEISEKLSQISLEAEDSAYKSELDRFLGLTAFPKQTE